MSDTAEFPTIRARDPVTEPNDIAAGTERSIEVRTLVFHAA